MLKTLTVGVFPVNVKPPPRQLRI